MEGLVCSKFALASVREIGRRIISRCKRGMVTVSTNRCEDVKHPSFEGRDENNFPCLTRLEAS